MAKKKFNLREALLNFYNRRTLAGTITRIVFVVLAVVWSVLQYLRIEKNICFRRIYIYDLLQYLMYFDIGVLLVIAICKRFKSRMAKVIACIIAFFLAVFAMAGSVILPMVQYMRYMYVPAATLQAQNGDKLLLLRSLDLDTEYIKPDDLVETSAVRWLAVADNEGSVVEGDLLAYAGMEPVIKAEWTESGDFRLYPEEPTELVTGEVTVRFEGEETASVPEGAAFVKSMTNPEKTHTVKLYRMADTMKVRKETMNNTVGMMLSDYGTIYQAFRMQNNLFFYWDYEKAADDGIRLSPNADVIPEFRSEWNEETQTIRVFSDDAAGESVVYYIHNAENVPETAPDTENP